MLDVGRGNSVLMSCILFSRRQDYFFALKYTRAQEAEERKMKKKTLVTVLAVAMTVSLLAGCGNTNQATQSSAEASTEASAATDATAEADQNGDNANTDATQAGEESTEVAGSEEAQSHYPVTITTYDFEKNPVELTFTEKPTKVVSGQQIWNEMLLYFDLDEYIVAAANSDSNVYGDMQARYDALPKIEDTWSNKEGIIAAEPEIFFGWRSHFSDDSLGNIYEWMDRGIQPVVLSCSNNACGSPSVEYVLQDFANLGAIFDIEDKTDAYIAEANTMLNEIKDTVAKLESPKTVLMLEYYEGSTSVYAWGTNSLSGQMITNAGGVNPVDQQGNLSLEDIIAYNPDKIILMNAGNSDTEEDRQSIYDAFYALEGLQSVPAVANKEVTIYALDDIYGGGIRIIPAIKSIYEWIYQE